MFKSLFAARRISQSLHFNATPRTNTPLTNRQAWRRVALIALLVLPVALIFVSRTARMDSSIGNVAVGTAPRAVAVNPVTNKIYVANQSSNDVTGH
jgi:hypothetical protein